MTIVPADCLDFLGSLDTDSVDLCFFSPPYESQRTYGIGFNLRGQDWVDWMVRVFEECRRVCTGLVACVCEGNTKRYRYSCAPALLMADLHRKGFVLRKPPIFYRSGIPGSGGPDWLRNDYEWIVCTTRGGKLPWSNNTACGHAPKYGPGGEFYFRKGKRAMVNQWGGDKKSSGGRESNGTRRSMNQPSHFYPEPETPSFFEQSVPTEAKEHKLPLSVRANPGNVIHVSVGGGLMGDPLAHQNEAPFPLKLAEFFVQSFSPAQGVVCDPFVGSGTTGHAALLWGRKFVGCDVRESQVELAKKRLGKVTSNLFP